MNAQTVAPGASWRRRFFTLWTAQALSLLSSSLVGFALVWWLTMTTGSATTLATGVLAGMLPHLLLGPIAGIMVVDYWLVRGRTLDVPDLYRPRGRYRGTNGVALLALALGVAPNVVGFLRSVKLMGGGPDLWDHIYPYSWFTGFVVAAIIHRQGMRGSRFGFADR